LLDPIPRSDQLILTVSKQPKPVKKPKKPLYRERLPLPQSEPSEVSDLHATPLPESNFTLRDDGTIADIHPSSFNLHTSAAIAPQLVFNDPNHGIWLYQGNCLQLLDAIAAKYPEGRFDMIFADPPYFLSNGGITCHAGKMVKVDKGDWDKSRGPELNHEFNLEWLRRCQSVLKPNGTIWVSGTHHVIFSIGYAMQQLGFKILNDIAWEKPNPPPNLSCRYFTHSTETILWAAKNEKSKHRFNYKQMREAAGGKQMKTVWSFVAPGKSEKQFGKHPTQKPIALVERCILASTNEGDSVLDPFSGTGATTIAAIKTKRNAVGIDMSEEWIKVAEKRAINAFNVSDWGVGTYVDDEISGVGNLTSIHRERPTKDSRGIRCFGFCEWKQEQRMGRLCSRTLHQYRSELYSGPERSWVGIENYFTAFAE
jgi:site-specific DNA-methyltransferase (adenine-specific)